MIKTIRSILLLICIGCTLVGCDEESSFVTEENLSSYVTEQATEKEDNAELHQYGMEFENVGKNATTIRKDSTLEVHYIDVGQGDSILIKQGQYSMLIDAGNNSKGTTVWSYLLHQDIEKLDYVVCTHPDADHIGGMDVVLYKFDCGEVLMPACENDTDSYEDLIRTIGQREQKVTVPERGVTYYLGEAQFQILSNADANYGDNSNNYSIALRLTFGDTSFLFTGDGEKEAEQNMINSELPLESDVYKVAHHGANWSNTEEFLAVVNPTYVVISCGEGNSYGHPRAEILNRLRSRGVKVFRTDEQGSIVAMSDGASISWNCSSSSTWKAGEPIGGEEDSATRQSTVETWQYILNINSKKIHYSHCNSVDQMSEKNKVYTNESKETLLEKGYTPCGICKP